MKMSFKFAFSVLILITFIFQAQTSQPGVLAQSVDNSGFPQVDLGPGFNTSSINFGYKFYNSTDQSNYTDILNTWQHEFSGNSTPIGSITSDSFSSTSSPNQVIVIFNSGTEAGSSEISAVKDALNHGKGLLYLVNTANSSIAAESFFTDLFQAPVVNFTSDIIHGSELGMQQNYVVSTQFSSPVTPVTENVTKLVLPDTVGVNINTTAIPEINNITIKDIYPIVVDPRNGQSLGIAIETGFYGRIVILGSSQIFSNDMFNLTGVYSNMYGLSNQLFSINIMKWLGRNTGYFHMLSHALNVDSLQKINRGFYVNATVGLTNEYNQTLKDAQVRFVLAVTNSIVNYNYMTYIGNNLFFGSISTKDARIGYYVDINVLLFKRGYIDQKFELGRVYINLEFKGPALPDLTISTVLIGGILIYLITAAYVWREFKKTGL